ncbi:MAG: YfcC family protein, partial [Oscillospiraceae bacterium]
MTTNKKKMSFPSAITVLFIVLILAAVMTYLVPAGSYSKMIYDADANLFRITDPSGTVTEMSPTQESLD